MLLSLYLIYHIYKCIKYQKKKYFHSLWSWLELLIALLTVLAIFFFIYRIFLDTSAHERLHANKKSYQSLRWSVRYFYVTITIQASLIFTLMLWLVSQLRFVRFFTPYFRTLHYALGTLTAILLILLVLLITFACFSNLVSSIFYISFAKIRLSDINKIK